MGNNDTKFTNPDMAKAEMDNDLQALVTSFKAVLDLKSEEIEKDIKGNPLIPSAVAPKILQSLSDLKKKASESDPQLPLVVYVLGPSKAGKSTLINKIAGEQVASESEILDKAETPGFEELSCKNLVLVDSRGIDRKYNVACLLREALDKSSILPVADVVLVCNTADGFNDSGVQNLVKLAKCLKERANREYGINIPILPIVTKLDTMLKSTKEPTDENLKMVLESNISYLKELFGEESTPFGVCIRYDVEYGVQELLKYLRTGEKFLHNISENKSIRFQCICNTFAARIIATFTALNGTISVLPLIDIAITYITTTYMLSILEVFSKNGRTKDGFIRAHLIAYTALGVARTAGSAAGMACNLTVIGAIVGTAVSAGSSSAITSVLGWKAYKFYASK